MRNVGGLTNIGKNTMINMYENVTTNPVILVANVKKKKLTQN